MSIISGETSSLSDHLFSIKGWTYRLTSDLVLTLAGESPSLVGRISGRDKQKENTRKLIDKYVHVHIRVNCSCVSQVCVRV